MTIASFDGKTPHIHPTAFVHKDATILGAAIVGARSTIWPGTILRADMNGRIVIGADTSIQDGSVAHLTEDWSETVVGDRVTVGHRVILHGCIVEDDCLIGMGSILLDNARIGRGSLVAAGSRADRAEIARWYRSTIDLLLQAIGGEPGVCKSCGKDITWIITKTGKRAPVTRDGLNHFADCPHAQTHRKAT